MNDVEDNDPRPELMKKLKAAVAALAEHFDSVQIIATKSGILMGKSERGTAKLGVGEGCYFSRVGAVREWLLEMDENTRVDARRNGSGDDDD